MKIAVTGTRGIPSIQGGVETHCRELYPRVASMGAKVYVMGRKPYAENPAPKDFNGVNLLWLPAPRFKSVEAITHTFLTIVKARLTGCKLIHIHACGPGLLTPFAKLMGMKVVFTHHGEDYDRAKWNAFAKRMLRLGENLSARFADHVIAISPHIAELVSDKYGINPTFIPNGITSIDVTPPDSNPKVTDEFHLAGKRLMVAVGRIVPEKGFHLLIDAFADSGLKDSWKLIIIGGADHQSDYAQSLARKAKEIGVILTGTLSHEKVVSLLSSANLFVMPSLHEGLPIALLEAMSLGKDILASDIPACRLPELDDDDFFSHADVQSLKNALVRKSKGIRQRKFDLSAYDWNRAAEETYRIYQQLLLPL